MQNSENIMSLAAELRSVAERLERLCFTSRTGAVPAAPRVLESVQPEAAPEPAPEALPEPSLAEVRGVLADISRAGFTAGVKALIGKYGADRLSAVNPRDYRALLKDAEELKNAG